jgi:hypothetical protein
MQSNAPSFADFVAEKIGHRNSYTRPRPAPVRSRGREYIAPIKWRSMQAAFTALFGIPAF